MKKNNIILGVISAIVSLIVGAILNYLALPAWTLRSAGLWWFVIATFAITVLVMSIPAYVIYARRRQNILWSLLPTGGIAAICLLVIIIGGLTSSKMFNAEKYQKLIQIEESGFSQDIPMAEDVEKISVVDMGTAVKLGQRTMGEMESLVSQFKICEAAYNLITKNGEQFRVSPLDYASVFKYNKNKFNGVPGYVLVDTLDQKAERIEPSENQRYTENAYFSYDLKRHVRSEFTTKILGKFSFEIDDEGKAWYVVPTLVPQIGFGGKVVDSVIVVDPVNGKMTEYGLEEVPKFIDHIYSLEYLMGKVEDNLRYVNGYFNFSQTGVRRTSYYYKSVPSETKTAFEGYTSIVIENEVYFFTGVTSAVSDESNLGFLLLSPRTGKVKFYSCPGAEESSAQGSAEGLVQNLGYDASFPIILNVDGMETYFMTLKDDAGLIKKYAMVNVRDYTIVVEANTVSGVLDSYRAKFNYVPVAEETLETTTGVVESIYQGQIEGLTYIYYKFVDDENLYKAPITIDETQFVVKVGETLSVKNTTTSNEKVKLVVEIEK